MLSPLWSIVLAGGEGRRLASVTGGIPKQFWSPSGGPTLLEETIARFKPLTSAATTVTIIGQSQQRHLDRLGSRGTFGRVILQPMDQGTAIGVLLGLSTMAPTPEAVLVLTPSDHAVEDAPRFRRDIRHAVHEVRHGRADVVLFAARPELPAGDLGWIVPSSDTTAPTSRLLSVGAFVEKPQPQDAWRLFDTGAACNTMVLVARVGALLDLYREHLPALAQVFDRASAIRFANDRATFLAHAYPTLRRADFSRDLLTLATGLHVHIWPSSIGWTDLGTPERLEEWLTKKRRREYRAPAPVNLAGRMALAG